MRPEEFPILRLITRTICRPSGRYKWKEDQVSVSFNTLERIFIRSAFQYRNWIKYPCLYQVNCLLTKLALCFFPHCISVGGLNFTDSTCILLEPLLGNMRSTNEFNELQLTVISGLGSHSFEIHSPNQVVDEVPKYTYVSGFPIWNSRDCKTKSKINQSRVFIKMNSEAS